MKIAACYIIKNEEHNLAESILSLKEQVDELIVVDTGSQDASKDVAEAHGAKVFDFAWQNDFAAARNFALEHVTADWVVFLDADEYFEAKLAGNLRRVIAQADEDGKELLLLPLRNLDKETGEVLLDSHVPRIFKASASFRYQGRIHEELKRNGQAIEHVGVVSPKELVLVHTGYSASISKEKARRNAGILLEELERGTASENIYMYLAEAYNGMEDEEHAVKYARLDVARGRRNIVYASRSWRILLRHLAQAPAAYEERRKFAEKAVQDFPELPEFHGEYAECLAFALDFPGAVREAETAIMLYRDYNPQNLEPMMFDDGMAEILTKRKEAWGRLIDRAGKLKLTACLIVRDGEADMASWLSNTAAFSDERIVVDTGSRDRTRELALSAGCRVHDFPWNDDFSRARNEAISHATGDWISVTDVDEAFEQPAQIKPFLSWLELMQPEVDAVLVPLLNVDEDAENRVMGRDRILRFFRNRRGLRYEGRIHENLRRADGGEPVLFQEGQRLSLRHWGYSMGRIHKKAVRNLELLREDIARQGEGPQHYRYLADTYSTLGDWQKTMTYAKKAMEAPLQSVVPDSRMEQLFLTAMRKLDCPFSEQEEMARTMCKTFPEKPDFCGILGVLLAEQGKYEEAISCMETALQLEEKARACGLPGGFSDEEGILAAWLALAHRKVGTGKEWEALLERALALSPEEDDVLNIARTLKAELSPGEFSHWLEAWLPPSRKNAMYLTRWAERNGQMDLLKYGRQKLKEEFAYELPRGDIYENMRSEEAGAFGEFIAARLAEDLRFLIMALFRMEEEGQPGWNSLAMQCSLLLPTVVREAWAAYRGEREEISLDGFRTLWPILLHVGSSSQVERLALLSFAWEGEWRKAAGDLMANERWEEALALYGRIPADSQEADGAFWHDVGVCLWHLGETGFLECFERARALGCEKADMRAYEVWRKEDGEA